MTNAADSAQGLPAARQAGGSGSGSSSPAQRTPDDQPQSLPESLPAPNSDNLDKPTVSDSAPEQPQVLVQPPSASPAPAPAEPAGPQAAGMAMRRTSTSSSSKLHDAIQDIISQFDPLKVSASTSQLPDAAASRARAEEDERRRQAELRAKFEPETDGFSYNDFLAQLRQPAAKPVARTVKSFLTEFGRRPMTLGEQVRFVHDFLEFVAAKMRECAVWQPLGERDYDNAREGMEKLVMNRLYPVCFAPAASDDAEKDHVLREKISLFRWIRPEHLDIPDGPQNAAFLQFAKTELLKMNNFKSPRDKAICILNCCTVIYALLRNSQGASDIGADRFLPLLIYVVITANPPRLVSNLQYIARFRSAERMQGEAGYYVTNLQGAMAFIESMDASCLSISQEEFDKSIEMTIWEIDIEKRAQARDAHAHAPAPDPGPERAQWLIDRSSDLAKSTLEKTNNFVGRLISELSTPSVSESGHSTPDPGHAQFPGAQARSRPQPPPPEQSAPAHNPHNAQDVEGAEAVDRAEWNSTLALVHDMFPNIDADVVELVFESNRGVVSRTIEQLLEMSMGNEALEVAQEHAAGEALEVPRDAPPHAQPEASQSQDVPSVGGENDVDEMERWKGQWADDDDESSSSVYEAEADNEPISAPDTDSRDEPANTFDGAEPANISDGAEPIDKPVLATGTDNGPDTSGDAELARRLQREFEQHHD
ncbi:hypothetical protein H4R23_001340 [Coemansia sp. Cherry 401B]|nr:hypothetical protein H4R23_001340 [Coemansia sp. Cherry 401B]